MSIVYPMSNLKMRESMNNAKYNVALNHALIIINSKIRVLNIQRQVETEKEETIEFLINELNGIKEDIKRLKINE